MVGRSTVARLSMRNADGGPGRAASTDGVLPLTQPFELFERWHIVFQVGMITVGTQREPDALPYTDSLSTELPRLCMLIAHALPVLLPVAWSSVDRVHW